MILRSDYKEIMKHITVTPQLARRLLDNLPPREAPFEKRRRV